MDGKHTHTHTHTHERMLIITNCQRNINQNQNEASLHMGQNGHHKKILQAISAGEGVEKKEPSYTVDGTINWYRHQGKQYGDSIKKNKLKIELPYNPAILLLCIYLDISIIQKVTCTLVYIAALFPTAWTWKQPKCPSAEK